MNLVFSSDNNYAQHLGVALCSLFENNKDDHFNIFVIDGGIDEENKRKLAFLEGKYNFKINYVKPDKELFKDVYISGHISEATYYRLSVGELLPHSIDKIIYLDCDIVIVGKIRELWNVSLGDYILAAVTEAGYVDYSRLGIKTKEDYFNAGVIILDLKKWREQNIGQKCFDFIKNNPDELVIWDQDALNQVLCGSWKKLDTRFNVMTQIKETINYSVIIHFNTWVKPWHYLCNHPQRSQYYKYLRMTMWKPFKPEIPTLKQFCRYYYYIFFNNKTQIFIRKNILNFLGIKKDVLK